MSDEILSIAQEETLEVIEDLGGTTRHVPRESIGEVLERRGYTKPLVAKTLVNLANEGYVTFRTVTKPFPTTGWRLTPKGMLYER